MSFFPNSFSYFTFFVFIDDDDEDEIAYFTVRWKTRASFIYRINACIAFLCLLCFEDWSLCMFKGPSCIVFGGLAVKLFAVVFRLSHNCLTYFGLQTIIRLGG